MTEGRREAHLRRQTTETQIELFVALEGAGQYDIHSGIAFLDHMLSHVAVHGLLDLTVRAEGDLHIDEHHTVEDIGISFGRALDQALGDRKGIMRMGCAYVPMDETLARVVIDLSGRPYAIIDAPFRTPAIGQLGTDLIVHFLESLATHARLTLHAHVLYGRNDHHMAEALFKALGRAIRQAVARDIGRHDVPSTKGLL